jgi:hypothetical protein
MDRINAFIKYFVLAISLYLIVNGLTYLATRKVYKDFDNYNIEFTKPAVTVSEAKTSYSSGHIKGNVKNDTGSLINLTYVKFDFYNERETYLGTEYKELKYFNVDETQNFNIQYKYTGVDKINISLIAEKPEREPTKLEKDLKTYWPVAGIIAIFYLL